MPDHEANTHHEYEIAGARLLTPEEVYERAMACAPREMQQSFEAAGCAPTMADAHAGFVDPRSLAQQESARAQCARLQGEAKSPNADCTARALDLAVRPEEGGDHERVVYTGPDRCKLPQESDVAFCRRVLRAVADNGAVEADIRVRAVENLYAMRHD